jgi:dihydroneopterin aldolase
MITIYIKDLVVKAKHGVHAQEKEQTQRFKINVELTFETSAAQTDNIDDTLNWSEIRDQIVSVTKNNSFNLVEKLAKAITEELLANTRIQKVIVEVDKLDAFPSGVPGVRLISNK